MDYRDLINNYSKDKKFNEGDKDSFFEKMMEYFGLQDLQVIWHIATHLDCAKKVFSLTDLALIAGGIAYVVMPLDAVPDFIPLGGLLDDAGVMGFVLKQIGDKLDEYRKRCM
jgi:uncharacterized membrane protein YkvA (DUF1232 family)